MGNGQSLQSFPPAHVRIYRNLLQIREPQTRVDMIRTLLSGAEYVSSARVAGVYAHLLGYVAQVESGKRPAPLPGELQAPAPTPSHSQGFVHDSRPPSYPGTLITQPLPAAGPPRPATQVVKGRRNEKALSYFQSCLEVLGLSEEVALTEEALKKAYKRAAVKAHPDKGGTEEDFEAITRAHAYLGEILRRIQGGRSKPGKVELVETLQDNRKTEAKQWEMVEPVRLNPKKLDLDAFNKMFEATRMPDPDEEGYGDWLKTEEGATGPKFSGKFNRDVFNRAFEEEAAKAGRGAAAGQELAVRQPEALMMAPTAGVELGRGRPDTYTAAANASIKFTDLKSAYTHENMITSQVADVRVEARSFDQYSAQWKQAPKPLADHEMAAVSAAEKAATEREKQRQLRAAHEDTMAGQYFERMKRLVITNK
jgi:hypothetical protein